MLHSPNNRLPSSPPTKQQLCTIQQLLPPTTTHSSKSHPSSTAPSVFCTLISKIQHNSAPTPSTTSNCTILLKSQQYTQPPPILSSRLLWTQVLANQEPNAQLGSETIALTPSIISTTSIGSISMCRALLPSPTMSSVIATSSGIPSNGDYSSKSSLLPSLSP